MAMPRTWLLALAALIVVPWVFVAVLYFGGAGTPEATPQIEGTGPSTQASSGAWGALTLTPIVISPPLEYVPADWGRNAAAEWVFPDATPDVVAVFLGSTGLSPEHLAQLMPRARQEPRIRGVVINPPPRPRASLVPGDPRAALHAALQEHVEF